MGNIVTYLKWRGDLDFKERPFCDADNLVLSCIAYLDFSGIVGSGPDGVTAAEASEQYFRLREAGERTPRDFDQMLLAMAQSRRYRDAVLSCYESRTDRTEECQFAALKIALGDALCTLEEPEERSRFYNQIFDTWIEPADTAQRETFIRDFFDALEANGATDIPQIQEGGLDGFGTILVSMAVFFFTHQEILLVSGSLVFGVLFLLGSVYLLKKVWKSSYGKIRRGLLTVASVLLFLLSCVSLVTPDASDWQKITSMGSVMVLYGMGTVLSRIYRSGEETRTELEAV